MVDSLHLLGGGRCRASLPIFLALGLLLTGCDIILPSAAPDEEVLAGPVVGLSGPQLATHLDGDGRFARVFSPAEGLGPLFVAASCESCHVGDGKGHDATTLTRFGRTEAGVFGPMTDFGGPQLQHRAIAGYAAETLPRQATGVTRLMAPAVTGLGFLEAVPDEAILSLSDPFDLDGDGISGTPNWIVLPDYLSPGPEKVRVNGRYIGRFGKKASAFDLVHQTANAYLQDMGLTTEFLPADLGHPDLGSGTGDIAPDPEISSDEFASVVFYVRTLKVPPRRGVLDAQVLSGERLFEDISCTSCHVPELPTGDADIGALANTTIRPYTDLLLHDMGGELDDGYTEGGARTSEWRTAPLWGIGLSADSQGGEARFLHDGRASSLTDAILLHGGEASASRAGFERLSESQKRDVIAFLESL